MAALGGGWRKLQAWYWQPRRIMAAMVIVFWGHMALWPDTYNSGTFTVVADIAPLRTWGVVLAAAGAAMFATTARHVWASLLVGALLIFWTTGLVAAVATGDSQSPGGFMFVLGFVQLLAWGVGRDLTRP